MDNPAGTVYKTRPNRWKKRGFHTPGLWTTCGQTAINCDAPPMGRLLLATVDDKSAGCVALKQKDDQVGELKRMFVRPSFRGQSIGWHLGQKLLEEARAIGYKKVYLDSHGTMTHAHKIYEEIGFKYISAPDSFPNEMRPFIVFMECEL